MIKLITFNYLKYGVRLHIILLLEKISNNCPLANIVKSFRYEIDRDASVVNWASKAKHFLYIRDVWFSRIVNVNDFAKLLRVRLIVNGCKRPKSKPHFPCSEK